MTKIDLTYDLANNTPADAIPVETNFNTIEQHINQELIERDGTVAMRAQLRLAADPVNVLDAAPKQYIDNLLAALKQTQTVLTAQTTSSTTYADLATVGPTVTMTTGRLVRITIAATCSSITGGDTCRVGVAVSGATTIAAGTAPGPPVAGPYTAAGQTNSATNTTIVTPGVNTFTLKYRGDDTGGGGVTAGFQDRVIIVERLD